MRVSPSYSIQIIFIIFGILVIIVAAVYGEALVSTLKTLEAEDNQTTTKSPSQGRRSLDIRADHPELLMRIDHELEARLRRREKENRVTINLASIGLAIVGSCIEILICSLFMCKKILKMAWTIVLSHVFIGFVIAFGLSIAFSFRINTLREYGAESSTKSEVIQEQSTGSQEAFLAFLVLNFVFIPFAIYYVMCCGKTKVDFREDTERGHHEGQGHGRGRGRGRGRGKGRGKKDKGKGRKKGRGRGKGRGKGHKVEGSPHHN